jgi:hypothetical protein
MQMNPEQTTGGIWGGREQVKRERRTPNVKMETEN